jgi:dihydrofolate reductase
LEAYVAKVIFDISMSLDGFMTSDNTRAEEPMGDGGQQLHEWADGGGGGADERNRALLSAERAAAGAMIAGRRTYDTSLAWWGADGPSGPARVPLVVVSHSEPDPMTIPEGGVYTFVDGIEPALERARQIAGSKNVSIMGGAAIGQQYIKAGHVDELLIHLVPVLFHRGTQMFDLIGGDRLQLEPIEVIDTPIATHLRYRVVAGASAPA